jgi:glycerophosphoryl diester phosphodiesterase
MPIPLLLGHRGVRGVKSAPENTLKAFDLALSQGCDGFELDVRLSADDEAVICHDAEVRGVSVAECSSAKLGLPLLREVLQRYRDSAFLDVELKVPGMEALVVDLLNSCPPAKGHVISSFLPEVLEKIHRLNAGTKLGIICETVAQFAKWPRLEVEYVMPHHKLVGPAAIERLKSEGRRVLVWTVNSVTDVMRFARWNVDGIISDSPGRAVAALHEDDPVKRR